MHTILVTGGAGFIGSNLIAALRGEGKRVVCVDNFSDNYDPRYKEENMRAFADDAEVVLYRTDIRDLPALQEIFTKEKPDAVVHLAAKADTRKSVGEPQEYVDVNITGTLNLLECARLAGVEKFVFASSSSVYGNRAQAPFTEDDITDCPVAPYGATKKAGEVLCYTYHHNFKLPVVCLRIFNAYGEANRPDLVMYQWIERLLAGKPIELSGEGERKRDFTYVGDLVRALQLALAKDAVGYEVVNVGNAEPVSLKDLLGVVERAVGVSAQVQKRESHPASVELTHADVSKARAFLGWEPRVSLEEGVGRLVAWMREHRVHGAQ